MRFRVAHNGHCGQQRELNMINKNSDIQKIERITGYTHKSEFKSMHQFIDRTGKPFRVILDEGISLDKKLEEIRKIRRFNKRMQRSTDKLAREFNLYRGGEHT